jgi:hypothetical protein
MLCALLYDLQRTVEKQRLCKRLSHYSEQIREFRQAPVSFILSAVGNPQLTLNTSLPHLCRIARPDVKTDVRRKQLSLQLEDFTTCVRPQFS